MDYFALYYAVLQTLLSDEMIPLHFLYKVVVGGFTGEGNSIDRVTGYKI